MKDNIIENRARLSHRANPRIDNENNSPFKEGFLDVPNIKDPKIKPAPIDPPASPKLANPAPINLADANISL